MDKELYKPLPDGLTIGKSKVQGLGLFTQFFVKKGTNFGVSHMKMNGMLIRTPLGGFINHSDTPNCVKSRYFMTNTNDIKIKHDYTKYDLITLEDIEGGEELTVKYTFYKVESNGKNLHSLTSKVSPTPSEKSQDDLEPIVNAPMMELE